MECSEKDEMELRTQAVQAVQAVSEGEEGEMA